MFVYFCIFFFVKQKTAYEMRISDWSSDVCSSDLRAATYSPVLPVSPTSGIVLQAPVTVIDADAGLVSFEDEGETITHSILSGGAKLQWKEIGRASCRARVCKYV